MGYSLPRSYTHTLDCSPTLDKVQVIKLNRSLTFIKSRQFDAALADLNPATMTTEKAMFRRAQAQYGLENTATAV